MISALRNYYIFNLNQVPSQSVQLGSNVADARIEVNGIDIPTGKFKGNLFAPVTLKAVAPAGYTFQGWNPSVPATMPAEDIELTAQWSIVTYNINYDLD